MSYEIELKARVNDPIDLKRKIETITRKTGESVEKEDIYYKRKDETLASFRVRRQDDCLLVTAKHNNRVDGIETNEEVEFKVDKTEFDNIISFASILGYEILLTKHKKGYAWYYSDILVELLDVRELGWFLEIEIISDTLGGKEHKVSRLYDFLALCNIDKNDICKESYQQMLQENKVLKES